MPQDQKPPQTATCCVLPRPVAARCGLLRPSCGLLWPCCGLPREELHGHLELPEDPLLRVELPEGQPQGELQEHL